MFVLFATQARISNRSARGKIARGVIPAPLLHTGNGNGEAGRCRYDDGRVHDAILFSADELFAIKDDYVGVGLIGNLQVGNAAALRRDGIGRVGVGARADLVVLDAPSYRYLAYRPGVPLARTLECG